MSPEERDALQANEVGGQIGEGNEQAAEMAEKATKGAFHAGMEGYHAGKTIKDQGFKNGAKSLAKEKVNKMAPVQAAKATVELSKLVKSKGAKAGAKAVAKGAAKAIKNAVLGGAKVLLIKAGVIAVIILLIVFAVILANTPAMIISGIGLDKAGEQEKLAESVDLSSDILSNDLFDMLECVFKSAKNWYYEKKEGKLVVQETDQEVTQEEMDKLLQAGDYDGVLSFYVEVTQRYLDMSYDDTVSAISSYADACVGLCTDPATGYDKQKTLDSIGDNPFSDTDYANIIAAYSTTDDYDTALLSRYKDKLRKAEGAGVYEGENSKPKFLLYTMERKSYTQTVQNTTSSEKSNTASSEKKKDTKSKKKKADNKKDNKDDDSEEPEQPSSYEQTVYWDEVTLIPFGISDIYEIFDIEPEAVYDKSIPDTDNLIDENGNAVTAITYEQAYTEYYTTLKNKLDELGYVSGGNSVSWGNYGTVLSEKEIKKMLDDLPAGTSGNRKQIIKVALDAVGRIPYNNTGERSWAKYGVNPKWGEPSSATAKHPYVGIDCSGFVQWVHRNALCDSKGKNPSSVYQGMGSTAVITSSGNGYLKKITRAELKPGDIGTIFLGGSTENNWNHTGIYIGNGKWVHCSGSKGTVVVSDNPGFEFFFRIKSDVIEKDNFLTNDIYLPYMNNAWLTNTSHVTDDELTVIATTLHNEFARDDGFRACAEAVYHYSKYNKKNMYQTVQIKNYLDAYTKLYVTHEWDPNTRRATSKQYEILDDVMQGKLTYFPNGETPYPVMYFNTTKVEMTGWRSKGHIVKRITADNGATVVFFYCEGVTYKGYR